MLPRLPAFVLLLTTSAALSQEIRRTPLTLKDGGTPEKPAVFDGKGMIIDLGIDVTAHDWEKRSGEESDATVYFARRTKFPITVRTLSPLHL